ncbi:asparagine synthase C-terminal domain-containing protein, partial [Magnetospirillum sp. SS-4]|uniref:asparagine synthase-related protein n=1 Tax=Magnetospirillum sp. SS-4 TaxID=2681465 RepID=UPI001C2D316E
SRLTRRKVTVALSGDGGDEMFGGYDRYFSTLYDQARFRAGELPYPEWRPDLAYYSTRLLQFPERDIAILFGEMPPGLAAELAGLRQALLRETRPLGNCLRELDARDYLPGAVLSKVDRMSMRHSLEVRAPLLGIKVAEFAASLAEDSCFAPGRGKLVLKEVARRHLPAGWLERPKKGFGIPMRGWGDRNLLAVARSLLRPGENRLSQWLGQASIEAFLADQDRAPMTYRIWAVVVLESWLRTHPARPF